MGNTKVEEIRARILDLVEEYQRIREDRARLFLGSRRFVTPGECSDRPSCAMPLMRCLISG